MSVTAVIKVVKDVGKFVINALKDPDKFKNNIIKILAIIFIIGVLFIVIPAAAISNPGLIAKPLLGEKIRIEDYDGTCTIEKSDIYNKIKSDYLDYLYAIQRRIDRNVEKIKEDNKKSVLVTDQNGDLVLDENGNPTYETVYPEVIVDTNILKPKYQYIYAYITVKYKTYQTDDVKFVYNPQEIKDFLDGITFFYESITESDEVFYYKAWTIIMEPEEIAETFFRNEDVSMFLTAYESFDTLEDAELINAYEGINIGEYTIHANGMEIVHFLQYDSKWGGVSYGSSTIAKAGCGPTCLAMVTSYLTGNAVSPVDVAKWSERNGHIDSNNNTYWSLMTSYPQAMGYKGTNLGHNGDAVIKALQNGQPVIARCGPGIFTKNGHFIVLRGITSEGKILVNDPNDNFYSKNYYNKEFDFVVIQTNATNYWSFSN